MANDWLKQLRALLGDDSSVETLDRFVSLQRTCADLRRNVWKAEAEATVWLAAIVGGLAGAMAFLVPELTEMYAAAGLAANFSWATRLVAKGAEIGPRWWLLVLLICLSAGLWPLVRRDASVKFSRRLPFLGSLLELIDQAEWSGMLALMLASRTAPQQALAQLAALLADNSWGMKSREWSERMASGQSLADSMHNGTVALPAVWSNLLSRDSEAFLPSLETISRMAESQARLRLTWLRAVLWPAGVLFLVPPGILWLQAVCGPILTYLRTWN